MNQENFNVVRLVASAATIAFTLGASAVGLMHFIEERNNDLDKQIQDNDRELRELRSELHDVANQYRSCKADSEHAIRSHDRRFNTISDEIGELKKQLASK